MNDLILLAVTAAEKHTLLNKYTANPFYNDHVCSQLSLT